MTSSVFAKLFAADKNLEEITLDDDENSFSWFLKHAYANHLTFPRNSGDAIDLFIFLKKYKMNKIVEYLIEVFQ